MRRTDFLTRLLADPYAACHLALAQRSCLDTLIVCNTSVDDCLYGLAKEISYIARNAGISYEGVSLYQVAKELCLSF